MFYPSGPAPVPQESPWVVRASSAIVDAAEEHDDVEPAECLDPAWMPSWLRAPTADELEACPGGRELVDVLALADPCALDEYALVELVAAWTRLTSWSQSQAAAAAAELARRAPMSVAPPPQVEVDRAGSAGRRRTRRPGRASARSVAAHELALRLCVTRDAAQRLIDLGRAIGGPLAPVGDAFRTGEIDAARARAIADGLQNAPLPVAVAVQEAVLPRAGRRTAGQVAHDVAAALVEVDEAEATRRHRRARAGRRVHHPSVLPDGMAGIWAVLPAGDAVALDLAVDAAATAARAAGDERSGDQLRADALASVGHAALVRGWIGAAPAASESHATAPGRSTSGALSSPTAGTTTGPSPSGIAPTGSGELGNARQAHGDESVTPDNRTGHCFRLGSVGGRSPRIRVTVPLNVLMPTPSGAPGDDTSAAPPGWPTDEAGPVRSGGPTTTGPDATDPRADVDPSLRRDPQVTGSGRRGPSSGIEPMAGTPRAAHLEGYGPISPDVARALASGGVWSRLVTDPLSGVVRDVGRTRYRPPAELTELVRTRDRTCVRPGCGAPASRCELDHTIPFQHGGSTAEWNLACLCPTDHRLKSAGGMSMRWHAPGILDVELPSGHVYRREPDGTARLLPRHDNRPPRATGWATAVLNPTAEQAAAVPAVLEPAHR